MYFSARISIDPSQLTKIERVEPDEMFRKFLHYVTAGATSKKVEHETFTTVSVLQQMNRLFWEIDINNIIRLSHDDIDIYYDKEGKKDDLKDALDAYELTVNDAMSHHFKTLHMVLEHEDNNFVYLIEIDINRIHAVGVYPIEIKVNALMKEFRKREGEDEESVKAKMKTRFSGQDVLDQFVQEQHLAFETFINDLGLRVRKHMKIDDVKIQIDKRVVMPKAKDRKPVFKGRRKNPTREYDPVFDGYHGFGDILLYSFLWSTLLHDHHMHVSDVTLVGDNADVLGSIGAEGIDAGDADLFNADMDFDSIGADSLGDVGGFDAVTDAGADSSWFDFGDIDVGGFDI
ncbi:hypothetical protein [Roseivirga misakiensis]|uniref:Uncharacterized protein n=1 Tax=Roseivirga misakiensis TaxID=1563681 RepID=A0A1E5T5J4_9BACT|nr:hypothetical protein [Roseivirga misakiensis]OEK06626.1 hypothetical protein BFP71_02870 [Roseivirga misakiensis]